MSIMKFLITYFLNSLSTINFNPPKLQYYVNKVKCQVFMFSEEGVQSDEK